MKTTFSAMRDAIQQGIYGIIDPPIRVLVKLGATPNMITLVGLLGNIVAAVFIVMAALETRFETVFGLPKRYDLLGWAGAIMLLFSIMDMVDGRMARTAEMTTRFGAFLDSVTDRYSELATLSALAFYFTYNDYQVLALFAFMALAGSIMVSYTRARGEAMGCDCKVGLMQRPERVVVTTLGLLLAGLLQDVVRPHFDPVWLVAVPVIVIAVLANITALVRIAHVRNQLLHPTSSHV